jgi:Fe-S oxidoreductase
LGNSENCCGDVVYQSGEEGFLEELVLSNIELFKKTSAQNIVSISPHCYSMFKSIYPKYGSTVQALHYTELLAQLVDADKLKANSSDDGRTSVTYHDPCYLGRYYGVYEQPRKILDSVSGIDLVEMEETKENALCCGGGGGQMWLDVVGERPSHRRVAQAVQTGASVLVSSCPYCIQNFEDGVKTKGLTSLSVMDVTEVLVRRLAHSGV